MKICIDAGHNFSGVDTGAVGAVYNEQNLTFLIADELKDILEKNGIEVVMTRNKITDNIGTKSTNESLIKRAQTANDANCDFFVSIHINAGGGKGAETYVYSTSSKAYEKAVKIQEEFKKAGRVNRGVKTASFSVLRNTKMPSMLVECGFIDNNDEEKWIMENKKTIAKIISSAFVISNDEYIECDEAIKILEKNKIISSVQKWTDYAQNNEDIKWLIKKTGTFLKNL